METETLKDFAEQITKGNIEVINKDVLINDYPRNIRNVALDRHFEDRERMAQNDIEMSRRLGDMVR